MSGIIALVHSLIPGSVTKLMLETPQAHTISIDSTTRTASITMAGKTFPIVACGGGGRWARCAQLNAHTDRAMGGVECCCLVHSRAPYFIV